MGIFYLFDFSNIPEYPNKFDKHCFLKSILTFHKGKDTITTHVTNFKVLVEWDITDDDTMIQLFVMSFSLIGN